MTNNRYASQVWKCLPIYDTYGKKSYERYLFKVIVRMAQDADLTIDEQNVLEMLKGLREVNSLATKDEIRSVILDCSQILYKQ